MSRARWGVTLAELMVALVILALMGSITVVGLRQADALVPHRDADRVAAARREAIARGHAVRFLLRDSASVHSALALPDGRVIGAPSQLPSVARGEDVHAPR